MGIAVETVAPSHQLLNFSERTWQEVKGLMIKKRRNTNKSIYNQRETLIELTRKFNLVSGIIHSTPLLVKAQDQSEKLMMKDALLKPHVGGQSLDHQMANFIVGVCFARDGIFEDILSYSKVVRDLVKYPDLPA